MARPAVDALLDEYSRLHKALEVLHLESDTDLPFDEWVEVVAVRFEPHTLALTWRAREGRWSRR